MPVIHGSFLFIGGLVKKKYIAKGHMVNIEFSILVFENEKPYSRKFTLLYHQNKYQNK